MQASSNQTHGSLILPVVRWMSISLRTVHLIGVAGIGGGFLYHMPLAVWKPYLVMLIISGAGMLLIDVWSNVWCLLQLRGITTIVKLVLLAASLFVGMHASILFSIIVISGLISHAPAKVRYFTFHKKAIALKQ